MQPYNSIRCLSRNESEIVTNPIKPDNLFSWEKIHDQNDDANEV